MGRIEKFRMLGELASEVAHDFNNALVSILGNTQFLLLDETEPARMEMLRSVEAAARDSVTMIKRIQEFGRSQSNAKQEHIDINALVKDAVTMTQSRWRDFVEPTMDLRAQQTVRGNQTELRRVLMNLIVNALDAMPRGGTLKLSTYDADAVQCIEVQDTGTGMLEHIQSRIFDPFFTTKAVGMGTGLGLSICQQIITQHGGTIAVRSKVGTGTTFTIRLPFHSDTQHDNDLLENTPLLTALICEPEPLLRAVIERFFVQQQYAITIVENGTELRRALSDQQWDVVIVDAALAQVVKLACISPASFVVVLADRTPKQAYDGADVVLVKPIDIAQLQQLVADIRTRSIAS
jgi:CheY-like chemotaxis protein